ncbi:tyrosine-protein phosphatase non-receptor type 18 [Antennarius striatus]|uniref:tyrosine-protein phosphatase non-receptor type 18 n=1 Tax=Antennarius striatus TaxID=241820 RepID=UPI0035B39549
MSDMYAVVTKPKHPRPPSGLHTDSHVATPLSNSANRTPPSCHHYDNDPAEIPIYSTVRPRAKPSATPIYDTPALSNDKQEEGLKYPDSDGEFHLMPNEQGEDDYEDFSSSFTDNQCVPGGIGFNCRVEKPRGPRDPPAEWSPLER